MIDNDVEPPEIAETEPTVELRRYFVKERQSFSRYRANEYLLLTDEGELETKKERYSNVF